jgi:uncharacterized protein
MELINLPYIAAQAQEKLDENYAFRVFLKQLDPNEVDENLKPIADKYLSEIDCTQCGNCCKKIMITLNHAEMEKIAIAINKPIEQCKNDYFETSTLSDTVIMSAMPCHFLSQNKCTVYEHRPSACASFPHLNLPNFTTRLLSMISGYGLCPQIYHSLEALKMHYNFKV